MMITAELTERGEDLTDRVADLVEDLDVVVGPLRQGQDRVRILFQGSTRSITNLAHRLASGGHAISSIGPSEYPLTRG